MKSYNIYCDESSVENKESSYFYIGALGFDRSKRDEFSTKLKDVLTEYDFHGEIKWRAIGKSNVEMYKKIIDFFVENKIIFRLIRVPKEKIKLDTYHNGDSELAFYKFYYLMLKWLFVINLKFYIFLDARNNHVRTRVKGLGHYLHSYLAGVEGASLEHIQAYDSKDNRFIQLADFFVGAVAYANSEGKSTHRKELIKYIQVNLELESLSKGSKKTYRKFNIFNLFGEA